jgi:hypothetical protein
VVLVRALRPPSYYRDYSLTVPYEATAAGESSLNRHVSVVRRRRRMRGEHGPHPAKLHSDCQT